MSFVKNGNTKMFVGRKKEQKLIAEIKANKKSKIIVINGRRRIGKSTLAMKAREKGERFLHFSGLSPIEGSTTQDQLNNFSRLLSDQIKVPVKPFSDWHEALGCISENINPDEYTVILFDEISWMGADDKLFVSKLKVWWDTDISLQNNILLIFCGSVSTWIQKNIINSTSFFGRISLVINLTQLTIAESVKMLKEIGFKGSAFEFYKILSVIGGVPWYLEQINPSLSADQNIKNLCFRKNGLLFSEFDKIFNDLFSRGGDVYKKILISLCNGMKTLSDIRSDIEYLHGGTLSELVDNLITCGFITKHNQWSLKTKAIGKQSVYRVCDPYIRFYLKYIKPNEHLINSDRFEDAELSHLKGFDSFMGFQVESLLLQNRNELLKKIDITDPLLDNPFIQKQTATKKGCQIDYLVQTRTNNLYVCELKFQRKILGSEIIEEMKEKLSRLYTPRGTAVVPVLFHIGGVTQPVQGFFLEA